MKNLKHLLILILLFLPITVLAQNSQTNTVFKAKVVEIIKEETVTMPDNSLVRQQNIKLVGLEGEFKGVEIIFEGIGGFDVVKKNIYHVGDKVQVLESLDHLNTKNYYIVDYARGQSLLLLLIVFLISLLVIGKWKGFRSIIALVGTFFVIVKYLIPQILAGANPITTTLLGAFAILLLIIYVTEGFEKKAHIAVVSILFNLLLTIFLSWLFVWLAKLSGLSSEESSFLIGVGENTINFQGLLLASIIIGTLGVLDDVVISQIATVEQLIEANRLLSAKEVFKKAYTVGISHISSMANTLFLAYAGVSMPLLILFASGKSAFSSWGQLIQNEQIATEIVRTLSGTVGLILAVPISTALAVWWLKIKKI